MRRESKYVTTKKIKAYTKIARKEKMRDKKLQTDRKKINGKSQSFPISNYF